VRPVKSRVSIQKALGHISAVLKGVLFIGISIQTVTGIVWMCCNFSHVPQFGDSLFYMQVSRTLRCDEYTGILYPVFLRIVRRNHFIVYGMQLAAAYAAARSFLCVFRPARGWKTVWGCLAFMTIPVVMQCHMAILPCSFAASLLLLELALLAGAVKKAENCTLKRLAEISLCWLLLALLLPEYLYLGAVPVVMFCFCSYGRWRENKRVRYHGLLLIAVFIGMTVGINSLTQTQGLYGRPQKTLLMTLTQRIAWTNILKDYESWPQQIFLWMDKDIVFQSAVYADGMDRALFPAMEQAVADHTITQRQAEEYYHALIDKAWTSHRTTIIKEIIWDMLGYGASPAVLQIFLRGRNYDFSCRNYDFFLEHSPGLSKFYMDYGSWQFNVAAALTAALQVFKLWGGRPEEKKGTVKAALCCVIMAGVLMFWYAMRGAGMLDYKNTAVIVQLWMAWAVLSGRERPGQ